MSDFPGKNIFFCILALFLFSQMAQADEQPWLKGSVNMQGAIFDAACAIATESREQIIDMHTLPTAEIIQRGQGGTHPFAIKLINCVLIQHDREPPNGNYFRMAFDGEADGELFRIQGSAKGIALQILDEKGNVAIPGIPFSYGETSSNAMQLKYNLRLVSNSTPLHAGEYSSALRFKLDYY
ncbi:fimbrial protein [Serratia nevei]|uniref:fimbrial protein n=1 Tax=Serratia nevei TaxID=2703794 RepID=UPI00313B2023